MAQIQFFDPTVERGVCAYVMHVLEGANYFLTPLQLTQFMFNIFESREICKNFSFITHNLNNWLTLSGSQLFQVKIFGNKLNLDFCRT